MLAPLHIFKFSSFLDPGAERVQRPWEPLLFRPFSEFSRERPFRPLWTYWPHIARYLRYYLCDTHIARYFLREAITLPQNGVIPPLGFTQAHLCDTPFCNVSCNTCAILHKEKQAQKSFARLSSQVSRDMKSIVAGPLSLQKANNVTSCDCL